MEPAIEFDEPAIQSEGEVIEVQAEFGQQKIKAKKAAKAAAGVENR